MNELKTPLVIGDGLVRDANGDSVSGLGFFPNGRPRMEVIVRCINNHNDLVKALECLVEFEEDCYDSCEERGGNTAHVRIRFAKARATLAKAKGELP